MRKLALVGSSALVGGLMALGLSTIPAAAQFGPPVTFAEGSSGIITAIPTAVPTINVASDGEVAFHPFGATTDTTDAIQFTAGPGVWNFVGPANNWTSPDGGATWFLPAILENEPPSEDLGTWVFAGGSSWNAGTPSAVILTEGAGGPTSDIIRLFDNARTGAAMITFQSDPIIPEASTWAMMLLGFAGLGFAGYRARRHTPALAA